MAPTQAAVTTRYSVFEIFQDGESWRIKSSVAGAAASYIRYASVGFDFVEDMPSAGKSQEFVAGT